MSGGPSQRFPAGFSGRNSPARLYTAVLPHRCCQITEKIWLGDNQLRNCDLILSVRSFFFIQSSSAVLIQIASCGYTKKLTSWTTKLSVSIQTLRGVKAKACLYVNISLYEVCWSSDSWKNWQHYIAFVTRHFVYICKGEIQSLTKLLRELGSRKSKNFDTL